MPGEVIQHISCDEFVDEAPRWWPLCDPAYDAAIVMIAVACILPDYRQTPSSEESHGSDPGSQPWPSHVLPYDPSPRQKARGSSDPSSCSAHQSMQFTLLSWWSRTIHGSQVKCVMLRSAHTPQDVLRTAHASTSHVGTQRSSRPISLLCVPVSVRVR